MYDNIYLYSCNNISLIMKANIFSINGEILPLTKAVCPITDIERIYGFGVYESIKVRNKIAYFISEHVDRLLFSAKCIDLVHNFQKDQISKYIGEYLEAILYEAINIKILLLGGRSKEEAQLVILPTPVYFPKDKWYKTGVSVYSFLHERWMPMAKTLNMLPSYYYFTKAKSMGGYDALFVDYAGNIREGSRTNFFAINKTIITSPPKKDILTGVTLMTLEKTIKNTNYTIEFKPISKQNLDKYDSFFLTSTSSKILPVSNIDNSVFRISKELIELMSKYNVALDASKGCFDLL